MIESQFTAAIKRKLHKDVYALKVSLRFAKDVADNWYSGKGGDLWVEWKYLKSTPKRFHTPKLSPGQRIWLNARYDEGRNVAVMVGCPDGGIIYQHKSWNEGLSTEHLVPRAELVNFIEKAVLL